MPLPRTPLLVLGVALESFVLGASCGSPSHSLSYSYLHLPEPIQGLPLFFIRGYLDDQPINRFESLTRKMEPLVPWMEAGEKEAFLAPEWVFRDDLETLSKLGHRAGGLHTWQVVLGCGLMEDGSKGGFLHYGYDGMDFISFDKETLRWVAVQPQAQKLKQKWDDDPGWSQRNKVFLEETCIEWLQRYLSYRNKTLQRIETPVGKVTLKEVDDHLEVLICQAFGFYPREIQATWTRDGEVCEYKTLPRNVAPNSDGTYYVWLSIEIDPKERDRFRCRLEHQGLQEPLILAWKEETGSLTHSLWYLPESEHNQGLPQSFIRGYLDDQPIARYDSLTGKMEPLVPWMEEVEKARFEALEWVFGADLEKLSDLNHQTGGPHTWQVNWGCELWEDGSKRGFLHYGYDGRDFISFDKETLRWVAAQPQAQKVKEKWEDHPGWAQRKETYLEKTCIEGLQRYLSYRKEAPQRIEPPVGKVTRKEVDDHVEVLICQAFGFYPKKIQATWTRDGEVCQYETLPRNVAPNSDGTYYVWLSIEIDPKERDHFRCRLEHQGLQEPLVLAWKEETAKVWWTCMVIVAASILGVGIFFQIHQWKRCRNDLYQEGTTCHDPTPSQSVPSFSMHPTEDETQSPLSPCYQNF